MSNEIEAKEVNVKELFREDFMFNIPVYQRPLSWGKDNFDQLFEDIYDAMTSSRQMQYFLGSIILQKHEHEKNKFDIVDGQQRISSLAILMAVIRDYTADDKLKKSLYSCLYQEEDKYKRIPEEMRVTPWEDLKEMFKKYICECGGTEKFMNDFDNNRVQYSDSQDPRYHLYEAISIFKEKLEEKLKKQKNLDDFVSYLIE